MHPRRRVGPYTVGLPGLLVLGALLTVAAGAGDDAATSGDPPPGSYAAAPRGGTASGGAGAARAPANDPGRLLVKFDAAVSEPLDLAAARGRSLGAAVGTPALDALGRTYGLRGIRPLRASDAALPTLAARRDAQAARRARSASRRASRGRARGSASATPAPAPDFTSVYVLEISPWLDPERAAREYAAQPGVAWSEPVRKAEAQLVPNDPFFASNGSWGQPFDDLWGLQRLDAAAAWDVARGAGVVVAVVDTGLDALHPDIQANVWANPLEIPGNLVDDDLNGYVDDVAGYDFANDDADPFDDNGHGTHVAGTVAATGDNGLGVVGVAFESRIMALKGLRADGGGTVDDLALAILYAADNGADVINASWGGFGSSQLIDDAIEAADAAGVVFVAAAGNSNVDLVQFPFFPASNARAITVSALDHLDQRASFSNFGPRIDVGAPGGGDAGAGFEPFRSILSLRSSGAGPELTGDNHLIVAGDYLRQAGTSMAAPHVAGAAAVILSAHPSYAPGEVRQALRAGADDVGPPGVDADAGFGRVNLATAVAVEVLDVAIASPAPGITATGDQLAVDGTAAGATFASYRLEYGSGTFPTAWTTIAGPSTSPVQDGALGVWDIDVVEDGSYTLRVVATNAAGTDFEDRVPLTLDRQVISAPVASTMQRLTGPVEIRGSAGGGGFESFRVEWRVTDPSFVSGPWRSDGMVLAGGGLTRVDDDLLATFTAPLSGNADVDFRLVITRAGGTQIAEETRHVILDPTLRAGWPQQIPGLPDFGFFGQLLQHTTVADLDDDGIKEILVAYGDMIWAYEPDGSQLAGWPQRLSGGTSTAPFIRRSPAAADLDGDGRLEVVAAETEGHPFEGRGSTYIWHADGSLMAGWPKEINQAYSPNPADPFSGTPRGYFALSDVDGNGQRDIVAVVGPSLVVMDTEGNFLPGWPQRFPAVLPCVGSDKECFEDIMAVGDVDGDGKKEIAIVSEDGTTMRRSHYLALYDSTGHMMPGFPQKFARRRYGMPAFFPRFGRDGGVVNAPVMGDLDGDGDLEIVVMLEEKKLAAFHHTGKRVRLPAVRGTKNHVCRGATMKPLNEAATLGDLDGDGTAEVLLGVHARNWTWKPKGSVLRVSVCPASVPGPDFLYALSARGLPKYADSHPAWPITFDYPAGDNVYGPGSVAIADVDGDLLPDVVSGAGICGVWDSSFGLAGHRCFTVRAFDAAGNLLPGFPKATPGPGPADGTTPAVADLDGDGLKEIVWVDFLGNLMVWTIPGTPGPEVPQWPMFRHDPAHTGALVANP
jgi:subtilisin family serine protease